MADCIEAGKWGAVCLSWGGLDEPKRLDGSSRRESERKRDHDKDAKYYFQGVREVLFTMTLTRSLTNSLVLQLESVF